MSNYEMPSGYAKPAQEQAQALGFCKAIPPEPKRYAQCRNCSQFRYDSSEYMDAKGREAWRRINLRCTLHKIVVQMGTVCLKHAYANADRGDR